MATIKDVAQLAGVSVTTVSVIINGKTEERRISPQTKEQVLAAMNQLGYQPNLSARRLRNQEMKKPVIAFFWPVDYRTNILATFLNHIQKELSAREFDCELVIQTYENDYLEQHAGAIIKNSYNGVIIGATSNKDMEYLESLTPQIPIVLINRISEKYSTVCVDSKEVGFAAARLFRQKGYTEAAAIASTHTYVATGYRTQAFLNACSQLGILVEKHHILRGHGTIEGGVMAAEEYCKLDNPPKAIFFESDAMAIGALHTFHKHNIRIPEDLEILTIALLNQESTQYTTPPLSAIQIPQDAISREVVNLLLTAMGRSVFSPKHVLIDSQIYLRESFSL